MRTFTIHEIKTDWDTKFFEIHKIQNDDILTFDDGLYSHYAFIDKILNNKNIKIFSISPNLLAKEGQNQETNNHIKNKKDSPFMNLKQIRFINSQENCYISMHGFKHIRLKPLIENHLITENEALEIFENDLIQCIKWFKINNFPTSTFCFPYNYTMNKKFIYFIQKYYPFIKKFINGRQNRLIITKKKTPRSLFFYKMSDIYKYLIFIDTIKIFFIFKLY